MNHELIEEFRSMKLSVLHGATVAEQQAMAKRVGELAKLYSPEEVFETAVLVGKEAVE